MRLRFRGNFMAMSRFRRTGIRSKLVSLFLLTSLAPFLLIGYYGYHTSSRSLEKNIKNSNQETVFNLSANMQHFLNTIPDDLDFLEDFHGLQRYLQWREIGDPYKTRLWWRDTRNAFYSFLLSRKIYADLWVMDKTGEMLLHIEYRHATGEAEVMSEEDTSAGHRVNRGFLEKVLDLGKGGILTEELTLRHDTFDGESQPILRYAMPIVDANHFTQGVLLLDLRAKTFLEPLQDSKRKISRESELLLVDEQGQYLYHPRPQLEWGLQREHGILLQHHFPALARQIREAPEAGQLMTHQAVFAYRRIHPVAGEDAGWTLIRQINAEQAFREIHAFRNFFIFTILFIVLVVYLSSSWFAGRVAAPLLKIRDQLKALSRGRLLEEEVYYSGDDEIADIIISGRQLKDSMRATIEQANAIATGNYSYEVVLLSDEDQLGEALGHMTRRLREMSTYNASQDWIKSGQTKLNSLMSGEQTTEELAGNIIRFITVYARASLGVIYLLEEEDRNNGESGVLRMTASYALGRKANLPGEIPLGHGLVGQAAREKQVMCLREVPENYLRIESALGEGIPRSIVIAPFTFEHNLKGVIELASFLPLEGDEAKFLDSILPAIGIAINTAESRARMQELLEETQTQAEELQSQSEELQSQTEELQTQQEELRQINEELEERTVDLERQKNEIRDKNETLEKTQSLIEAKARELELASKYKSEFLANMSHELRTPLNSMLILAQLLAENKAGNLTEKQVEYARTIRGSGSDLLALINDILDLAKVESGKIEVHGEQYRLADLTENLELKFGHVAEEKGVGFEVEVAEGLPETLYTDSQRLKQIINNMLSNAFKFTTRGEVRLRVGRPESGLPGFERLELEPARTVMFQVSDSGIGIAPEKLQLIFEAFQQADGTTSRRFGGTGLGLSISRQLARLLGGDINAESVEGQGSTFYLYLPEEMPQKAVTASREESGEAVAGEPAPAMPHETETSPLELERERRAEQIAEATQLEELADAGDDRHHLHPDDKFILLIEDDHNFARILMELAREKDFKCLYAPDGQTGLRLAREYKPNAVILDVGLPKMDGWTVMEHLKEDPETRHIPVHFISASDQDRDARRMGAIGYLLKPVSMAELSEAFHRLESFIARDIRNLLVVTGNERQREEILGLVGSEDVNALIAESGETAWNLLQQQEVDCIILDLDVEQARGIHLLERLANEEDFSAIPVIVHAGRELSPEEEAILHRLEAQLTIKEVHTPERLLDEATLFLHQLEAKLPKEKRKMLRGVHDKEAILVGKKVLVVDDDMRNTFALATILEDRDMEVEVAKDGKEALEILEREHEAFDLVLMDIMMPEMDGYEAMQRIRQQERFRRLPIIALTAKAMKGDKAKCIEAGANDYLSKPVDTDKLMSLMRVWLYR